VHVHFILLRFVGLGCHCQPKEVRQLTACAGLPLAFELAMLSVLALVRTAPLLLVGILVSFAFNPWWRSVQGIPRPSFDGSTLHHPAIIPRNIEAQPSREETLTRIESGLHEPMMRQS
jgi:hypothetical protein